MGGPPGSQVVPLPTNLPFRLVSKTIGSGAYASIRKATPLRAPKPVIAVKFINKEHAFRSGRLRPKQLQLEIALHKSVCPHQNIIRYHDHGEDAAWVWMCLELAEGGDLFDKIEADQGVGEDVAHFYFTQLVSAIGWCHGKGVAHRDIKPENMLLSREGDLKLADFGLATQFVEPRTGARKACGMVCGSPPYIAPEILDVGKRNQKRKSGDEKAGYDPQVADVWSCAIVLFVLLVGNTPWDSPVLEESYEYHDYVSSKGRPSDELWTGVPTAALSLVRGMLNIDAVDRFTLDNVRKHPWFTRTNRHLNDKGKVADPVHLATQMLESLRIDFSAPIQSSQSQHQRSATWARGADAMEVDSEPTTAPSDALDPAWARFASTQPETPVGDAHFDWEAPRRPGGVLVSASQPQPGGAPSPPPPPSAPPPSSTLQDLFLEDPSLSQFSQQPAVPLTLTQAARQFNDIVPSHSLARFLSVLPLPAFLPMLLDALHRLNIPVAAPPAASTLGNGGEAALSLRIKTLDARQQPLQGSVVVERIRIGVGGAAGAEGELLEVRFVKAKGDPLGWRRLFKQVAVLCKDGIVVPPPSSQD